MNDRNKPRLILMRHAKSDWSETGVADFDRRLAPRGRKTAPRMGRWLRKHDCIPDAFLSSPARRARETALAVGKELGIRKRRIQWDRRIYEGSLEDLVAVLQECSGVAGTLLLVGHNPGLDELFLYLCEGEPARDAKGRLLTTGAVAVLQFPGEFRFERGGGRLLTLLRPADLKRS